MIDLSGYEPAHRQRLRRRLASAEWSRVLDRIDLESARSRVAPPPPAPSQLRRAAEILMERNAPAVRRLLDDGVTDRPALLRAVASWEPILGTRFPILFLGLVVTLDCSFQPRCIYCNQQLLPHRMTLADWKRIISEAADPIHPYIYLTGGEPFLLGPGLWGDDGIIAHATRLGCAVNVNTNAAAITPEIALRLVSIGTARLHVSLDDPDDAVQDSLLGKPNRARRVRRGILNLQIARLLLGASHPQIHINCVLTSRNLPHAPALLRLLLEFRPLPQNGAVEGVLGDFAFHFIPVGGESNAPIRPTPEEWKRFHTETWNEMEAVWASYLRDAGVPSENHGPLTAHVPFASPYSRVEHRGSLDDYCADAGRGVYWTGALSESCYLSPCQAYVLPDGTQHRCGAHAIRRTDPIGNVLEPLENGSGGPSRDGEISGADLPLATILRDNIRRGMAGLGALPGPDCVGCAGATCVINRSMEAAFLAKIDEMTAKAV